MIWSSRLNIPNHCSNIMFITVNARFETLNATRHFSYSTCHVLTLAP